MNFALFLSAIAAGVSSFTLGPHKTFKPQSLTQDFTRAPRRDSRRGPPLFLDQAPDPSLGRVGTGAACLFLNVISQLDR